MFIHTHAQRLEPFGVTWLFCKGKMLPSRLSGDAEPAPNMTGGVGTWRYMAPEVARHEAYTETRLTSVSLEGEERSRHWQEGVLEVWLLA